MLGDCEVDLPFALPSAVNVRLMSVFPSAPYAPPSGVMQEKSMKLIVEPAVMEDPESKKYPELFENHRSSLDTWTLGDKGAALCVCACAVADIGYL